MIITQQTTLKIKQKGVTLVEILVVVVIIGILMTAAVPSYRANIEQNRLKEVVNAFKSDMQLARTEAVKQNRYVFISRSPGNAGAWCYGLNIDENCSCGTANSCSIKTVSGSEFSNQVSMAASTANNSRFDFRQGTIGAGGVTFSTANYQARVTFNNVGRIGICTPSETTGLSGYKECE